jgi:hypothetical protein
VSKDVFQVPASSRIKAKVIYSPADTVHGGRLIIRDLNNQIMAEIKVEGAGPIDVTEYLQSSKAGIVEAHLTRGDGHGLWTLILHLYAVPSGSVPDIKATTHRDSDHLVSSIEFQRKA